MAGARDDMTTLVVVGLQWGDEGKGKVVDRLAADATAVARFHGGHNAGHTIYHDGERVILHIIPSGILHAHAQCFIGPGVVVSPPHLFEEIAMLQARGIAATERLFVSPLCPLLLECHQRVDVAREQAARCAIGTTGRGIGPAYEDRAARRGLVVGDLRDVDAARVRLRDLFEYHNFMLVNYYRAEAVDVEAEIDRLFERRDALLAMAEAFDARLKACRADGERLLIEGAQGAMLDTVYGSYPYVTSSHTVGAYAPVGLGIPPQSISRTLGVIKAYATRVGNGDFLTELGADDAAGAHLSERGREVGATTGRARRCGWLDLVAVKRAVELSGVDALCVTKLDVFDGMETIRCCLEYDAAGRAEYTEMAGWSGSVSGARAMDDLPAEARAYIEMIEERTQCPVEFVSTGAARDDGIIRADLFRGD